ncbi:PREDICTED: dual specificity protein phosphatase 22-B-like [Amphimedon queenslandica]|uniref:Tyrosine-protein phosphatase domain-containing protein n=1 Tax=Amphimedon queenslandica TaxID=400682 RepID=A0A1X7VEN8_AMPQE|nr:PREDICTED: dual specificity protein phosphatase 22-B-like [Amphimedon queenslandica]|eukprot:XP_003384397.2 PREDICTED: dual specificity protein phosphatase 22-B-like [Amphimedon queenslandica]
MGNSIDKVCTGLYVGGIMGASKKELLLENNITHVLAVLDNAEPHFPENFQYKCIKISDSPSCDLSVHFKESVDFIHKCRIEGGSCYVHCAAGISRSVTLCTVYLMTATTLSYEDAMTVMVYARSMAGPNFGFRMQMMKYTKTILNDERKRLKSEFPDNKLNDEQELGDLLKAAKEKFAKEGRPLTLRDHDEEAYIDPEKV